jgi:hypothetical protein
MIHVLVGDRTEEDAKLFIRHLVGQLSAPPPLFTSDELRHYKDALAVCYAAYVPVPKTGRQGRPRHPIRQINPQLLYATVHKERVDQRVVKVESRIVYGSPEAIGKTLSESTFSTSINTAGVERHNLNLRQHSRRLIRKTNGFSKKRRNLKAQVLLVMAYYNFVLKHGTLKVKGQTGRTPAMEASLADRPWTMRELMTFRIVEN